MFFSSQSSGTRRTTRLPSVLSTWICSVLLPRSISGQSTHSRRSWLLSGSCVRQGACWKCVSLRGQGNAASWLSELHPPFSVDQMLSSRSQTHYSSVSTRCTDQSHQCWMRWVRAMSVPSLLKRRLVQPRLAQLRLPGLADQYSLLVLPILAAQVRRLLGLQLQVHPRRQCMVLSWDKEILTLSLPST